MERFSGIGASNGLVLGPALVWRKSTLRVDRRHIEASEVEGQLDRFDAALEMTRQELEGLRSQLRGNLGEEHARILDAQLLLLEDADLLEAIREGVESERLSAGAAFARAMGEALVPLQVSGDGLFRERIDDFRDVEQRILRALSGGIDERPELEKPSIVVAQVLSPSETAGMDPSLILGFCIDEGGPTSHTAIIARSLGVPCVVGLKALSQRLSTGDELMLDGVSGQVVLEPEDVARKRFAARVRRRREAEEKLLTLREFPAITPDGHRVELAANAELPVEIGLAMKNGAKGIGLLRTEYFYFQRGQIPHEEEQLEAYRDILRRAEGETVIFRVLDVGGDKLLAAMGGYREYNPFLGWRGVRYLLSNPHLLRAQLRALYRASADGPLKIMFPMISGVEELRRLNEIAEVVRKDLAAEGHAMADAVEVGIMIETPSAVAMAPELAKECDFFSIGTNDLTQYVLAVDRTNARVAHLHRASHPAVLRAIRQTIDAAHEAGIWVGICGEMGANPTLAVLLVGMGIDEISTNAASIPVVKKAIRTIRYETAQEWAEETLRLPTADAVDHYLRVKTQRSLRDILHEDDDPEERPAEETA